MKNTIIKWLLFYDETGMMQVEEKEVNIFIPVNRMLDQVGYYQLDLLKVKTMHYLIVYDSSEPIHSQKKILVSKVHSNEQGDFLIDLTADDYVHMPIIAKHYLKTAS
ncbi:MAG: hypothetical protein ACLFRI_06820 [Candidatus Izemoplasmataceae bacterium]